jgi:hypothetical protein
MTFSVAIPGFVQAVLTGVISFIVGKLFGVPFGGLQIAIVVVVVIIAHILVQLFFRVVRGPRT